MLYISDYHSFENKLNFEYIDEFRCWDNKNELLVRSILSRFCPEAEFNLYLNGRAARNLNEWYHGKDPSEFFKEYGTKEIIKIKDLVFSQSRISIRTSKNPSHPIEVIKLDGKYVLYDGNHRTIEALVNGKNEMTCLVLDMDKINGVTEHKYSHLKKESPLKVGKATSSLPKTPKPVEGGVVLILSNPFKDGLSRVYMRLIDKVREDNESDTIRVDLCHYYILKEQPGGKILPEMIEPLTPRQRREILNMENNGLYLNENKTPLWQISCTLGKVSFFGRYQPLLKTLKQNYNVLIPPTQSKNKPNLH